MNALHAHWLSGGRLALWAEDATAYGAHRPTALRTPGRPSAHPYACPADGTARLLAGLGPGPGWLSGQAAERWVTLHLPSLGGAPTPSPQLPVGAVRQGTVLTAWRVPALVLAGPHTAQLLGELFDPHAAAALSQPDGGGPPVEVAYGAALRWLTAVHDLAWRMAGRGRVLPVVREQDGDAYARWQPAPETPDRAEAAALAAGCPPAALAAEPPRAAGRRSADALLADALDTLTDLEVRAALAGSVPPAADGPVGIWLTALHTGDGRLAAAPTGLADRLATWYAGAPADPAARLCLRLSEPLGPAADDPDGLPDEDDWRLDLLLQATDRPSLLVAAADLWERGPAYAALARTVDPPEAALAAELDRAAHLHPPLRELARRIRPTGLRLDRSGALDFLRDGAPALADAGFGVLLPAWWQRRPALGLALTATTGTPGAVEQPARIDRDDVVAFHWQAALGDTRLDADELAELAAAQQGLVRLRGRWVEVDAARIGAALAFLTRHADGVMAAADLLRLALDDSARVAGLPVTAVHADGPIGDLLAGRAGVGPQAVAGPPPGFTGTLRPYQQRGLDWLHALGRLGLGAVLADDMGLGKTVQTLALLALEHAEGATGPTLLVCPTSLVGNWQREAARFVPGLRVHVHHGAERGPVTTVAADADLVITTYGIAQRDAARLGSVHWRRIVADEAQAVKNTATERSRALRALRSGPRIALTGTPVENRLAELHAVLDFTNPGLFGTAEAFRERFAVPVEQNANEGAAARLRRLAGPFVLRRLKSDPAIALDLPAKQEFTVHCNLTAEQAGLYQAVVADLLGRVAGIRGVERKGAVLSALGRLKQVCNHPAQLLHDRSGLAGRSGKVDRLEELLGQALAAGDRTLVFTQYAAFAGRLAPYLAERLGTEVLHLHGRVPRAARERLVDRFQQPDGPGVFILSLRAGGTGLNLTAANQVVHLDRWWNPAVEDQATDRAHRIGQRRDVQVRRLVCVGTVEERIADLIESKRALAGAVVGEGEQWLTELSADALRDLLTLSADAIGA